MRCCAAKPHALPCRNGDTPLTVANRYGRTYVSAFLRSAVDDALALFRGKNLKVKRSSGAIEGGWQLAAGAQVDASGMVELVMGDLLRATSLKELMQLNSELVRVARGELTPEEILAGLCMGQDVFQSRSHDKL